MPRPHGARPAAPRAASAESVRNDPEDTAPLAAGGTVEASPGGPRFDPPDAPGEVGRLGKYRVLSELGRGGMGAVYLAFDARLERKVALKIMLPKAAADATARDRFLREARAAARVSSDHVVAIYEADEINGTPYIALQYLQGYPLDEYLNKKGNPTVAQVIRIGRETALGLAAAHALGLVHRDIKPGNLWLEAPTGRVKVLDFGLAKPVEGAEGSELTATGAVVGTPAYMAPEQGRGRPVDGRADLFSLGCVLYRLCTGNLPFARSTLMEILLAIATEEPPPIRAVNPAVPEALADLIRRLMAKDPAGRPASAAAVAEEFRAMAAGSRPEMVAPAAALPVVYAPMAVSIQEANPFADIDAEADPATELLTAAAAPPAKPPRKFPVVLLGSLFFGALTLFGAGFIVIKITNKDGSTTEVRVPDGSKVEVNGKTIVPAAAGPKAPDVPPEPLPPWPPPAAIPVGQSPFDKLDPAAIPKDERFDWQPKELVAVIGTHTRRFWSFISSVGISDDGSTAVSNVNSNVTVWDVATGKPLRRLKADYFTASVQFAEKGTRLYGLNPHGLEMWDITTDSPKKLAGLTGEHRYGYAVVVLEGGKTVFTHHAGDKAMTLFAAAGGALVPGDVVNGPVVAAAAADADVVVYNGAAGKLRRAGVKNAKLVNDAELPIPFDPNRAGPGLRRDGKALAVAAPGAVVLWDLAADPPKERGRIPYETDRPAVLSPCGRWAVIGNGGAQLWRIDGPAPQAVGMVDDFSERRFNTTLVVEFSRDGNRVIAGNDVGHVRFWDLSGATPKELAPADPAAGTLISYGTSMTYPRLSRATGVAMLPQAVRDAGRPDREWRAWAFDGPTPRPVGRPADAPRPERNACLWPAANGTWVPASLNPGVYRIAAGRWQVAPAPVESLDPNGLVTPDGKLYLGQTADGLPSVSGWDVSGTGPVRKWDVPYPQKLSTAAVGLLRVVGSSHDSSRFATLLGTEGALPQLTVWRNTRGRAELQATRIVEPRGWYFAAMSPDGRFLAHSGNTNPNEAEILDLTGKELQPVGVVPAYTSVAYSPDGRYLATTSQGVFVFDAKTLAPVWKWECPQGLVDWVDWAADGRHLVMLNHNGTVYVVRLNGVAKP